MIVSDVQVCLFGHWFAMSRSCGLPLVPVVDAALTKQESRCTYKVLLQGDDGSKEVYTKSQDYAMEPIVW